MNILYIGNSAHQISANLAERANKYPYLTIDAIFPLEKNKNNFIFKDKYHKVFWYKCFYNKLKIPMINGIINSIRLFICLLKLKNYDIIHLHYVTSNFYFLLPAIKFKSKHFIISFWGSDFVELNKKTAILKKILNTSNVITCTNNNLKESISSLLPNSSKKAKVIPFAMNVLDEILKLDSFSKKDIKLKMGIPSDHLVICCGTNARTMQHHLQIIEEIARVKDKFNKQIFLLFPMSYGETTNDYIKLINIKLKKYDFLYKKLMSYMKDEEVAMSRIISDILIQVQDHDQFSGATLETIYANNIVITGSWLPYSKLDDYGTYYFKVDQVTDIHKTVLNCINNYDELAVNIQGNRKAIDEISSNATISQTWVDFYRSICN